MFRRAFLGLSLFAMINPLSVPPPAEERRPIRVAVIGGMTMTGMWDKLAAQFEADTGWKTQLVITGPKAVISAPFKRCEIDVLTMHTADKTTDLVADGYG